MKDAIAVEGPPISSSSCSFAAPENDDADGRESTPCEQGQIAAPDHSQVRARRIRRSTPRPGCGDRPTLPKASLARATGPGRCAGVAAFTSA